MSVIEDMDKISLGSRGTYDYSMVLIYKHKSRPYITCQGYSLATFVIFVGCVHIQVQIKAVTTVQVDITASHNI